MDASRRDAALGEKYAFIAMTRAPVDINLPAEFGIADDVWVTQMPPVCLSEDWKEWIGSIRAEQLLVATLWLCTACSSRTPGVLDAENVALRDRIGRFYQGLLLATPLRMDGESVIVTGANVDGRTGVRQMSTLDNLAWTPGRPPVTITEAKCDTALRLANKLGAFPSGRYLRLCRVLNAFMKGLHETDVRERLHQFCRVIEGLILADPGHTRKQFKSRTELFVGVGNHELMETIYNNRSAVEHMNDPIVTGADDTAKQKSFMRLTIIAEDIARFCLQRVLLTPDLLACYENDDSLRGFWSSSRKATLWGASLDLATCPAPNSL
ncbi:hypothetical protein [Cupriavidus sp. D39]|uniref:hypothetical protein n=1 Tax=Cupriavidus sp. D39 TaxID=2997877 RepID=UPI0022722219|nr:hypothetical protein [Cupriavidus sp. D39]MCY0852534.1 hypothetical protein [Cupriavidus sp. D39]